MEAANLEKKHRKQSQPENPVQLLHIKEQDDRRKLFANKELVNRRSHQLIFQQVEKDWGDSSWASDMTRGVCV